MREINQETIIEAVKQLCIEANSVLPCDVRQALKEAYVPRHRYGLCICGDGAGCSCSGLAF